MRVTHVCVAFFLSQVAAGAFEWTLVWWVVFGKSEELCSAELSLHVRRVVPYHTDDHIVTYVA